MRKGMLLYFVTEGMRVLVVGSGAIGRRKISKLVESGAEVTVVTKDDAKGLDAMGVEVERGDGLEYLSRNLDRFDMIVAATDSKEINSKISELAMRHRKLVVSVTSHEECNVMFPAVLDYKKFQIGITTHGLDPKLSRKIKEKLSLMIRPEEFC